MKKALIVLALLCLGAGDGEIEGWKVIAGIWKGEDQLMCEGRGILEWPDEFKQSVEIALTIKIRAWLADNPRSGCVAVVWSGGAGDDKDSPRNVLTIMRSGVGEFVLNHPAMGIKKISRWM